jgi:hypothetical protein
MSVLTGTIGCVRLVDDLIRTCYRVCMQQRSLSLLMGVFAFRLASAQAPQVLPLSTVDLHLALTQNQAASSPLYIHQVVGNASDLYFLTSNTPTGANPFVIHTDPAGQIKNTFNLAPARITAFGIAPAGRLAVAGSDKAGSVVYTYDSNGVLLQTASVSEPVLAFAVNGPALMTISSVGTVHSSSFTGHLDMTWASSAPRRLGFIVPLSNHTIVAADSAPGVLRFMDYSAGKELPITVSAPEVTAALKAYSDRAAASTQVAGQKAARPIIFNAIAPASDGGLYVNVTGRPLADGAVVLKLDSSGATEKTIHLALPTTKDYATESNRTGYMVPSYLGVSGQHLIVTDSRGMVAVYPIS